MKKLLLSIFAISFCSIAIAHTIDWYVDGSVYTTTNCSSGDNVIPPTAPAKFGYTFSRWVYYTPIEYLESTGTQYIDTGFKPNQDTRAVLTYSSTNDFGIGTRTSANVNSYIAFQNNQRLFFSDYKSTRLKKEITLSNEKTLIDKNKNITTLTRGSETLAEFTHAPETFQTIYNLPLFASTSEGTPVKLIGKIYSFQLYDNGTLIRDMIPVLDPANNNVPCMYDRVSEQYFYNAGTGNFIAGPVISE